MICIDGKKVKKCFLGDEAIGKVYLGDELIFQKISRLPVGYTELKYISNPNLGYISNFGLAAASAPFGNKKFEISMKINDPYNSAYSSGAYIFGAYCSYKTSSSASATTIQTEHGLYYSTRGTINNVGGGSISISDMIGDVLNITWDYISKTLTVNGKGPASITAPSKMSKSIAPALFASRLASYTVNSLTSTIYRLMINCNLYSLRIYQNDAIINEWVPCINPDGLVGIYDLVTGDFQSSGDATKPLVAGPTI